MVKFKYVKFYIAVYCFKCRLEFIFQHRGEWGWMGHFSFLRPNLKSIELRRKSLNYYDRPFSLPEISNACYFSNFNSLGDINIFLNL